MVAATQQGVVQPDVCNPLDKGDHHRWIAIHQHRVLRHFQKISLEQNDKHRSAPKRKAEYALHLLPIYTHAVISGSWMQ